MMYPSKDLCPYVTRLFAPHLLVVPSLRNGTVLLGLMEEDLLHLAVLQVVQLSHCILGACDQVHDHSHRTLTTQEAMLR